MAGSLAQGAALHTTGLSGVTRLVTLAAVACRAVQKGQGSTARVGYTAGPVCYTWRHNRMADTGRIYEINAWRPGAFWLSCLFAWQALWVPDTVAHAELVSGCNCVHAASKGTLV